MKAILVEFSLMTRIIVPDEFDIDNMSDADYATLREKAVPRLHEKLDTEGIGDLLGEVREDEEIPYGEGSDDVYYQPSFDDISKVEGLYSFQVFASKEVAQKAFPGVEILEYHGDDIQGKTFVDKQFF